MGRRRHKQRKLGERRDWENDIRNLGLNPIPPTFVAVLLKFWLKKKRSMEKNFYERRAYESVDDRSLSRAISKKLTGKRSWAAMG